MHGKIIKTIVAGFLVCILAYSASAAEIRLLDRNPIYFDGYWKRTSDIHSGSYSYSGFNHPHGSLLNEFENCNLSDTACPDPRDSAELNQRKSKAVGEMTWMFNEGLKLDGALSYGDIHSRAAVTSAELGRVVLISGPIESGDAERLAKYVQANGLMDCLKPGYCPFNNVIALDSPGGSLTEALKIAEYVNTNNFITLLPRNATCASACSLVFLSGYTSFEGFFYPRRFAHHTAQLGLHQPYMMFPERTYSADEVGRIVEIINISLNKVVELFTGANLGIEILKEMYATGPDEMYYLTVPELQSIGMLYQSTEVPRFDMTRARALALCAEDYKARFGHYNPALLERMASNDEVFVTYVPRTSYACYGAKRDGVWAYDVCLPQTEPLVDGNPCALYKCGALFETAHCAGKYDQDIVDFYNQDIGDALAAMRNSKLLQLTRDSIRSAPPPQLAPSPTHTSRGSALVPSWVEYARVPEQYCGRIDMRAVPNLKRLQEALNANGINVGTPDGSIGPRTLGAIGKANQRFFGKESQWAKPELLNALGIPAASIQSFMLCP